MSTSASSFPLLFSCLVAQKPLLGNGMTHSWLGLPTLTNNQDNHPESCTGKPDLRNGFVSLCSGECILWHVDTKQVTSTNMNKEHKTSSCWSWRVKSWERTVSVRRDDGSLRPRAEASPAVKDEWVPCDVWGWVRQWQIPGRGFPSEGSPHPGESAQSTETLKAAHSGTLVSPEDQGLGGNGFLRCLVFIENT